VIDEIPFLGADFEICPNERADEFDQTEPVIAVELVHGRGLHFLSQHIRKRTLGISYSGRLDRPDPAANAETAGGRVGPLLAPGFASNWTARAGQKTPSFGFSGGALHLPITEKCLNMR
jgi:hypothetical protein